MPSSWSRKMENPQSLRQRQSPPSAPWGGLYEFVFFFNASPVVPQRRTTSSSLSISHHPVTRSKIALCDSQQPFPSFLLLQQDITGSPRRGGSKGSSVAGIAVVSSSEGRKREGSVLLPEWCGKKSAARPVFLLSVFCVQAYRVCIRAIK